MIIDRDSYDRKPLFIKQGALRLWGIPLARRVDLCRVRQLYSFSHYFAEMCFDKETGKLTCICTFTHSHRLTPYLDQVGLDQLVQ
ncbi:hypothetical protein HNV11_08415 [Spirosoma taeanense]|uniref:Uncharacterized protein n=1 Tax=Spirosoma taeanense TaxID=2735870 RepID=A0A6M5Y6C6_9BACT|nr:hypothetical protein [Spirosoma taeanense]QJW89405.1 hypothetical protein HNV11_08415 [Spirosoma taeanense]